MRAATISERHSVVVLDAEYTGCPSNTRPRMRCTAPASPSRPLEIPPCPDCLWSTYVSVVGVSSNLSHRASYSPSPPPAALTLSSNKICTELSVEQVQELPAFSHGVISNAEAGVSTSKNAASSPFCPKDPGIVAVSGLYVCFLCRRSSRANTIRNNAPSTPATIPYDRVN